MSESEDQLKALLLDSLKKRIEDEKIGRVFHDFNNILSSSMGYANLALERATNNGDEKLARYLENIERAGIRARDLVRESLDARRSARNADQSDVLKVLAKVFPDVAIDADLSALPVHYAEDQLLLTLTLLANTYSGVKQVSAKVIEDFNCPACGADLRGQQVLLHAPNVERGDTGGNDLALVAALVNSQGGHVCESLLQIGKFDVYLRSVVPG